MPIVNNKELKYDGGWVLKESLNILNNEKEIDITFSADETEDVNSTQLEAYQWLKNNLENVEVKVKKIAETYINDNESDILPYINKKTMPIDVCEILTLHYILITEEGKIAFCFDAAWDDHGITVVTDQNEYLIGTDDEMWFEL